MNHVRGGFDASSCGFCQRTATDGGPRRVQLTAQQFTEAVQVREVRHHQSWPRVTVGHIKCCHGYTTTNLPDAANQTNQPHKSPNEQKPTNHITAGYWSYNLHQDIVSSVLRPHQHSIGYTGDGFYRSNDPTNSIKVLKEDLQKTKKTTKTTKYRYT